MLPVCYLYVTCMLHVCDQETPGDTRSRQQPSRANGSRWVPPGAAGSRQPPPGAVCCLLSEIPTLDMTTAAPGGSRWLLTAPGGFGDTQQLPTTPSDSHLLPVARGSSWCALGPRCGTQQLQRRMEAHGGSRWLLAAPGG